MNKKEVQIERVKIKMPDGTAQMAEIEVVAGTFKRNKYYVMPIIVVRAIGERVQRDLGELT